MNERENEFYQHQTSVHWQFNPRSSTSNYLNSQKEMEASAESQIRNEGDASQQRQVQHPRSNVSSSYAVSRAFSVYGIEETATIEGAVLMTPSHLQKRKPLHTGVKLEAIDHEMSKQKINSLMS